MSFTLHHGDSRDVIKTISDCSIDSVVTDPPYALVSIVKRFRKNGSPPSCAHEAAHSCGNGHLGCVNPNHLRWATRKQNHEDRLAHGTLPRGVRNGKSKLEESQVIEILRASHLPNVILAQQYGVSRQAINLIRKRKNWGWLIASHEGELTCAG